jgi:riboflavin transporter FmnP
MNRTNTRTNKIVLIGMLTALATVFYYTLEIPIILPHLKMDFSDIPALIGAIALGPVAGITIEVLKGALHLLRTSTFGIGELINIAIGVGMILSFCTVKKIMEKKGAAKAWVYSTALVVSMVVTILVGMASNYLLFPPYFRLLGQEVNMTVVMGAVYSSVALNTVKTIVTVVPLLPFLQKIENLAKTKAYQ